MKIITASVSIGLLLASVASATSPKDPDSLRQSPGTAGASVTAPPGMTLIPATDAAIIGMDEKEIQDLGTENPAELKVLAGSVPRHTVELAAYFMDNTEVTNRQWLVYLQATGQEPNEELVKLSWKDGKIPAGEEDHPVVCVSFNEVRDYARWAMKRLPTEIEWEYAARGPEGLAYPYGNEFDSQAGHSATSRMKGPRRWQQTGTMPAGKSPFGLLDMSGNVWEWTDSLYLPYDKYQDIKVKTRFRKGKYEKFSAAEFFNSQMRVLRGGAYDSKKIPLMSALRQGADRKTWFNTVGFRCAKSARPGLDALHYATEEIGSYAFRDYELNLDDVLARELTRHDENGMVTDHTGLAFAPVKGWPKLKTVQTQSKKGPVPVGLITFTEDVLIPRIPAGTYLLAYEAANKKVKQQEAEFPDEGWVYHGWQENQSSWGKKDAKKTAPKKAPKKSSKKKSSKKDETADAKDGAKDEKDGDEADAEPDTGFQANLGSVTYDRKQDNLLLMNRMQSVLAALPLAELKEGGKPVPAKLDTQKMGADERRNIPETERYTFKFTVEAANKKSVPFDMPLRFAPGMFEGSDDVVVGKISDEESPK